MSGTKIHKSVWDSWSWPALPERQRFGPWPDKKKLTTCKPISTVTTRIAVGQGFWQRHAEGSLLVFVVSLRSQLSLFLRVHHRSAAVCYCLSALCLFFLQNHRSYWSLCQDSHWQAVPPPHTHTHRHLSQTCSPNSFNLQAAYDRSSIDTSQLKQIPGFLTESTCSCRPTWLAIQIHEVKKCSYGFCCWVLWSCSKHFTCWHIS